MGMADSPLSCASVIIDQVDVASVFGGESEDDPPVGVDRHRPESLEAAFHPHISAECALNELARQGLIETLNAR